MFRDFEFSSGKTIRRTDGVPSGSPVVVEADQLSVPVVVSVNAHDAGERVGIEVLTVGPAFEDCSRCDGIGNLIVDGVESDRKFFLLNRDITRSMIQALTDPEKPEGRY